MKKKYYNDTEAEVSSVRNIYNIPALNHHHLKVHNEILSLNMFVRASGRDRFQSRRQFVTQSVIQRCDSAGMDC